MVWFWFILIVRKQDSNSIEKMLDSESSHTFSSASIFPLGPLTCFHWLAPVRSSPFLSGTPFSVRARRLCSSSFEACSLLTDSWSSSTFTIKITTLIRFFFFPTWMISGKDLNSKTYFLSELLSGELGEAVVVVWPFSHADTHVWSLLSNKT